MENKQSVLVQQLCALPNSSCLSRTEEIKWTEGERPSERLVLVQLVLLWHQAEREVDSIVPLQGFPACSLAKPWHIRS